MSDTVLSVEVIEDVLRQGKGAPVLMRYPDGSLGWATPPPPIRNRARLNAALARSFWKEALHGGFW